MTRAKCPHCGKTIELSRPGDDSRKFDAGRLYAIRRSMTSMQSVSSLGHPDAPASAGAGWQKVTPVGRLEPKDVTTAIYDAGISMALVTVGAVPVIWWQGWPWWTAPTAGFTIGLWRYFGGIRLAQGLLEMVETVTGADINNDGHVGPTEPARPVRVQVELRDDAGHWQFADLPGEPASLQALAWAVTEGESFAERTATNSGYTQEQWTSLRDVFVDRGWARWNHETRRQQGVSLLRPGRNILRAIADTPLPGEALSVQSDHVRTQQHAADDAARLNSGNYTFID